MMNELHIIYYGIPGSYTHQASELLCKRHGIQPKSIIGFPSAQEVWKSISADTYAIIPIENSTAGRVHHHQYEFIRYPYSILAEYYLDIHHCLLGYKDKSSESVYSHPQALAQCRGYLERKELLGLEYNDTAAAAKYISEQKEGYAIASSKAAKLYDLDIIDENIQDKEDNTTRFFLVGVEELAGVFQKKKNRIHIVLLRVKDQPGILHTCLGCFKEQNISLSKIESIPDPDDAFSYLFWIECKSNDAKAMIECLKQLEMHCKDIRKLGVF